VAPPQPGAATGARARARVGGAGAFGQAAAPAAGSGTRAVPYQKTQDTDSQTSAGGQKQIVYFSSITAMPAYQAKSVEELRAEDYAVRPAAARRRPTGLAADAWVRVKSTACACM